MLKFTSLYKITFYGILNYVSFSGKTGDRKNIVKEI